MKRFLALLLLITMLASFSACTEQRSVNDESSAIESSESDDSSNIDNTSEATPKKEPFSLGSQTASVYLNSFIGIGCKLNGDWTFYTDEELKLANGLSPELSYKKTVTELKKKPWFYDMGAYKSDGTNVCVVLEKCTRPFNAEDYLSEHALNVFKTEIINTYGYEDVIVGKTTVYIGNETFPAQRAIIDTRVYDALVLDVIIECDEYVAKISITAPSEDMAYQILGKFYMIK